MRATCYGERQFIKGSYLIFLELEFLFFILVLDLLGLPCFITEKLLFDLLLRLTLDLYFFNFFYDDFFMLLLEDFRLYFFTLWLLDDGRDDLLVNSDFYYRC